METRVRTPLGLRRSAAISELRSSEWPRIGPAAHEAVTAVTASCSVTRPKKQISGVWAARRGIRLADDVSSSFRSTVTLVHTDAVLEAVREFLDTVLCPPLHDPSVTPVSHPGHG
jgi:hypothetical protein